MTTHSPAVDAPPAPRAPESMRAVLDVGGMTCAACQVNVQRALARQDGVQDAAVNLMTGEARVVFDPSLVDVPRLVAAVEAVGYDAAPAATRQRSEISAAQAMDVEATGRRAAVSLAVGALAMVVSMPTMVPHAAHGALPMDPLMLWVQARVTPWLSAAAPWLYAVPRQWLLWALLAATVFVMAWAGRRFYVSGLRALRHGAPDMNSLVAVGTLAAFAFSLAATLWPARLAAAGVAPDVYYEAVIIIIAFVLAGRWLEGRARHQAVLALQGLASLQPREAVVLSAAGEERRPLDRVRVGEIVLVRSGARVPLDGVVVDGRSDVDESSVTGESLPVVKEPSDAVTAGTLVTNGVLRVRVAAEAGQDTLSRIVELMRDAQLSRAPIQRLADSVSAVFVPSVLVLSVITLVAWALLGGRGALGQGLAAAVAVLIVACPCAMGLAVPTAVLVATSRGSAMGVLIKGGEALQRASLIRTVVLDKTGTVTVGQPAVVHALVLEADRDHALSVAAALERGSDHPVAKAIAAYADAAPRIEAGEFHNEPGHGVTALIDGRRAMAGSVDWLAAQGTDVSDPAVHAFVERARAAGATVAGVAVERAPGGAVPLVCVFAVADAVRATSAEAVRALRAAGVDVVMLSGDHQQAADAVGAQTGIDRVVAGALPTRKLDEVRRLKDAGGVAMVGDGINDAPALALADVGFAMGGGTDVAIHAADVTVMRPDLRLVAATIHLARAAVAIMRQNLFWAFAYNVVAIPLAAGALYPTFGVLLSPTVASAAMALSSVSVVANSLRLRRMSLGLSDPLRP